MHSILQVQKTRLMKLLAMRYLGFVMRYVKGNKATLHISVSVFQQTSLQVSAKVGPVGKVIEINTMFMYSVNSVLWRLITGRPIEPQTASRITFTIREAFRVAERSSISDILQVREL